MNKLCALVCLILSGLMGFLHADSKLNLTEKGVFDFLVNCLTPPSITEPIKELLKHDLYAIQNNPYAQEGAQVRIAQCPLCDDELAFRTQRTNHIKKSQENFLSMELDESDVLEIGIASSGGGCRAMFGALGSLVACEKTGLLDCVYCVGGLSGSTWLIAPWMTSGKSLADYEIDAINCMTNGLVPGSPAEIKLIVDALLVKYAFDQDITIIDLYGALLANKLLNAYGDYRQQVYMSGSTNTSIPNQKDLIASGTLPLPVYTCVLGVMGYAQEWFECTPYEFGSRWLGMYVPTWAFGRNFNNGASTDYAPAQTLGTLMGTFGSAFAVDFANIYDAIIKGAVGHSYLAEILTGIAHSQLGSIRLTGGTFENFSYGVTNSPLKAADDLTLVDAGLSFNHPIFATYRTPPAGDAPDIIIILDHSATIGIEQLKLAQNYAQKHALKFPAMDDPTCYQRLMTVFKDDTDLTVPIVIYLPRINDQAELDSVRNDPAYASFIHYLDNFDAESCTQRGYAMTTNFFYSTFQAAQWSSLLEFNMLRCTEKIKQVMIDRILEKRLYKKNYC